MTEHEIRQIATSGDNEPMREIALHLLDAFADYPDEGARVAREAECMTAGEGKLEAIKRRGARVARDMAAVEQGVRGAGVLWEHLNRAQSECEAVLLLSLLERLNLWDAGFPATLACYLSTEMLAVYADRYAEIWRTAKACS